MHRSDGAIACLVANQPLADDQPYVDCEPFVLHVEIPCQAKPNRFALLELGVVPYLVRPPQQYPADESKPWLFEGTSVLKHMQASRFWNEEPFWHEPMRCSWNEKLQKSIRVFEKADLHLEWDEHGNGALGDTACVFEAKGFDINTTDLRVWLHEDSDIGDDPLSKTDVLNALASLPWVDG